jgi:hypothetical protein
LAHGIYDASGATRVTVVSGAARTGLFAADGSLNVVLATGVVYVGSYHACGALYVTLTTTRTDHYAPDGSMYVAESSGLGALYVIAVSGSLGGALPTPTLTWTSVPSDSTPTVNAAVEIGLMIEGDDWELEFDDNTSFTSPVLITGTVSAPDAIDGDIDSASGEIIPDGLTYARFRVLRAAAPITNWSNTASETIDAPPVMTSSSAFDVTEGDTFVGTLSAHQPATFAIGGTDAAFFQMDGNDLEFISAPDYDAPADAGANNIYDITITPTAIADSEAGSAQSVAVTVEPIGDYAATTAFLARSVTSGGTISSRLDVTHINAVKAFINGLNDDGIWGNFDGIYLLATQAIGADNQDILRMNLVQNAFNLTGAGGTFVADRGWTDGGGSATKAVFTPSTAGGFYTLNDAHLSIWGNAPHATRISDMGITGGGSSTGIGFRADATFTMGLNQASLAPALTASPVPDGTGLLWGQRVAASGAGAVQAFWGDMSGSSTVQIGSSSVASTALSSSVLTIGAISGTQYSSRQLAAGSFGKSMSAGDIEKYFDRLQTYMTAIGNV